MGFNKELRQVENNTLLVEPLVTQLSIKAIKDMKKKDKMTGELY